MGTCNAMSKVGALITPFVAQVCRSNHLCCSSHRIAFKVISWTSLISDFVRLGCILLCLAPQFLCFHSRWCSGHQYIWPCRCTVSAVFWLALHPWSCQSRLWAGVCRSLVFTWRLENRRPPQPANQMVERPPKTRKEQLQLMKKQKRRDTQVAADATVAC